MQPFDSSDSIRTREPLKHAMCFELDGALPLERNNGVLPEVTVCYETWGTLSPARDNAVLICHALSGDSHCAQHDEKDDPGWWDILVGPGKPIDTNRYFVICPNVLGGCRGTTGPNSNNPATGKPWGADFPLITVGDMVEVQKRLVHHLGIKKLLGVVGGSLGGHMVLTWASRFPEMVTSAIALATSPRLSSQSLAFDVVGRNAILRDPHFHNGQYYDKGEGPAVGLAIARMLGHITYLSREAMTAKFDFDRHCPRAMDTDFETRFSVGSYLAYQGNKFVERFDANSYITITTAMDLFDLGATPEAIARSLSKCQCRWLVISFSSDWLFPPAESRQIVDALISLERPVSYCDIQSNCGHDAFLLENEFKYYGGMVKAFLGSACGCQPLSACSGNDAADRDPTSIYNNRLDYDSILELIPANASVLDLGSGTGGLLARLRDRGHQRITGVELSEDAILACLQRGLDVVHLDINKGLSAFHDGQFDYVVLSQTLQAVTQIKTVVNDMLRVGKKCIVSFPNFAHRVLREQLYREGKAPRAGSLMGYSWHETPNIRFLSILDFEDFCRENGIHIDRCVALDTEAGSEVHEDPNRNADMAVMVISREKPTPTNT